MHAGAYIEVYYCTECGRKYQKKQVRKVNNQYPSIPDDGNCSCIFNFGSVKHGLDSGFKFCGGIGTIKYEGKQYVSGFREVIVHDTHANLVALKFFVDFQSASL